MEETGISRTNCEFISEDTIQCFYFSPNISDGFDFEQLCVKVNKYIETLSEDYLWHRDEFKIHLPIYKKEHNISEIPPHLVSTTCFGDNIEDEWFIVYIVLEITKKFNLIAHLGDADGNFLLIEAADCLPSWAKPETTNNRIFICDGHIHIIPPEIDATTTLNLKDAIRLVAQFKKETKASEAIEKAILQRIGNYPDKMKENFHNAVVKLPLEIASLLTLKPKLVSAFVSTYCGHDFIDAKTCRNVTLQDSVIVQVKFTKLMYAILMHSKLLNIFRYSNTVANEKKCVLGLKLACGFHMLMSKPVTDIFSTKQYLQFLTNLKEHGYFKDNLEGSEEYTELLSKAKIFFLNTECPRNSSIYNEVKQLMTTQEFRDVKEVLATRGTVDFNEDNDDWLNIQPDQLNDLLNTRYGSKKNNTNDNTAHNITSQLTNFLKNMSDFEGIEISEEPECIDFDSDDFTKAVEKMLNIISEANDSANSDFSEESDEDIQEVSSDMEAEEDKTTVMQNMVQSMKEEATTGPSSNLLRSIGIHKSDLLDSDDD